MPGTFSEFLQFPVLVEQKMQQLLRLLLDDVTAGTVNARQPIIPGSSKDIDYLKITQMASAVDTASTSVTIAASGVTTLNSTGTKVCVLAAPVVGVVKRIIQTAGSTEYKITTGGTSVATFNGTGHILTFDALHDAIEMVGLSTTRWGIMSNIGSVTAATV